MILAGWALHAMASFAVPLVFAHFLALLVAPVDDWGWLRGVAGTVLAVPVTISILVVCAHVGPLRPIALLLSDETDVEGLDRVTSGHGS